MPRRELERPYDPWQNEGDPFEYEAPPEDEVPPPEEPDERPEDDEPPPDDAEQDQEGRRFCWRCDLTLQENEIAYHTHELDLCRACWELMRRCGICNERIPDDVFNPFAAAICPDCAVPPKRLRVPQAEHFIPKSDLLRKRWIWNSSSVPTQNS